MEFKKSLLDRVESKIDRLKSRNLDNEKSWKTLILTN